MAWIIITAGDVQRRLAAQELTALTTAAKAASQSAETILSDAMADVVKRVRSYVAGCTKNMLGPAGTIPDELKAATLTLIRDYLFTRLPGLQSLNDETRREETRQAFRELRDVAACRMAIVPPETPAAQQAAGPSAELVSGRKRVTGREQTGGLL